MGFKSYIQIARPDHWVKNIFVLPGVVLAYFQLASHRTDIYASQLAFLLIIGLLATCLVASANYVINEYLDSEFDRFHPEKKNRAAVQNQLSRKIVFIEYLCLLGAGYTLSFFINIQFFTVLLIFSICALFYNVKPFRVKDIAYLDVLFESLNNVIRLLLGWYIIMNTSITPLSLMISFWMAGAFLMATKRLAEYRQIGNPEIAGQYRRSFYSYTELSLLMSAVFYAVIFAFVFGIFLYKYRMEFILTVPIFSILFVLYLEFAMRPQSRAKSPEKLYKETWLLSLIFIIVIAIAILSVVDIPVLEKLFLSRNR